MPIPASRAGTRLELHVPEPVDGGDRGEEPRSGWPRPLTVGPGVGRGHHQRCGVDAGPEQRRVGPEDQMGGGRGEDVPTVEGGPGFRAPGPGAPGSRWPGSASLRCGGGGRQHRSDRWRTPSRHPRRPRPSASAVRCPAPPATTVRRARLGHPLSGWPPTGGRSRRRGRPRPAPPPRRGGGRSGPAWPPLRPHRTAPPDGRGRSPGLWGAKRCSTAWTTPTNSSAVP